MKWEEVEPEAYLDLGTFDLRRVRRYPKDSMRYKFYLLNNQKIFIGYQAHNFKEEFIYEANSSSTIVLKEIEHKQQSKEPTQ